MGAGGGGEVPGLGATHWPRAFSSQLTSSTQPEATPGSSSGICPVPFPREPTLDPNPGGGDLPALQPPRGPRPPSRGWGGLSGLISVACAPTPKGPVGGGGGAQAGAALLCFRILHLGSLWRPDGLLPLLGSPRGPAGLTTSMNAGKGAACPPRHPACRTGSAPRPTPPGPPASPPGAIMWPCPPLLEPSLQQGAMDREGSTGTPAAA